MVDGSNESPWDAICCEKVFNFLTPPTPEMLIGWKLKNEILAQKKISDVHHQESFKTSYISWGYVEICKSYITFCKIPYVHKQLFFM